MTFNNLDWDELRFFLAAVQSGTYSGAAEMLNVDRTTVGRRIKELERRLGVSLFEQTATGYQPSDAGRKVLASARFIENELANMLDQIAQEEHEIAGQLRVCAPTGIGPSLMPTIKSFYALHPKVIVELVESTHVLESIVSRKADVGLCFADMLPHSVRSIKVATCKLLCYQSKSIESHTSSSQPDSKTQWITWGSEVDDSWLKSLSPIRHESAIKVNSWQAMHSAIQAGLGVGQLFEFMAKDDEQLIQIFNNDSQTHIDSWLITHNDVPNTERAEVFIDFMLRFLNQEWQTEIKPAAVTAE